MLKEDPDWFKELYSEVPADFPPTLVLKTGQAFRLTFEEERPRIVTGGYGKRTAVINVLYQEEPRTLFISNADLARQIWKIWKINHFSLKGLRVIIAKTSKKGRNWIYTVRPDH